MSKPQPESRRDDGSQPEEPQLRTPRASDGYDHTGIPNVELSEVNTFYDQFD